MLELGFNDMSHSKLVQRTSDNCLLNSIYQADETLKQLFSLLSYKKYLIRYTFAMCLILAYLGAVRTYFVLF